jgi:hypothetical protein
MYIYLLDFPHEQRAADLPARLTGYRGDRRLKSTDRPTSYYLYWHC